VDPDSRDVIRKPFKRAFSCCNNKREGDGKGEEREKYPHNKHLNNYVNIKK
jgi:hypothetical protein